MADFEKLGVFYLGREFDPAAQAPTAEPLLYDSRDLTTHAVCVGMTGSGKTGLCVALLEEAAIDGIPAIAIDPKGDLGNLMLTFPALEPGDFRPWVDAGDSGTDGALATLVEALLEQRQQARETKDFATADRVRDQLTAAGVEIEDTPQGPRWSVS